MASLHAMLGNRDAALQDAGQATTVAETDNETVFFVAVTCARLGDRDRALEWLQRAATMGYSRAEIRMRVDFDLLRSDPRFAALITSR
jgi:hypothetical protein